MSRPISVLLNSFGIMRFFSSGERLTHNSSSGIVKVERKYLTSFIHSRASSSPFNFASPVSTIKSIFNGLTGSIVTPWITGGAYSGVVAIIVPGAGRFKNDCAAGWAKPKEGKPKLHTKQKRIKSILYLRKN